MPGRRSQDAQRQIEAVLARDQREARLVRKLRRQCRVLVAPDVRRIADDQIVAAAGQGRVSVGLDALDPIADAVVIGIDPRQCQRCRRKVDQIDRGIAPVGRHRDADAAAATAKIKRSLDRASAQPGFEAALDQFRDRRARNQHIRGHLEGHAGKPGLAGQVGHRHALLNPALNARQQQRALLGQQHGAGVGGWQVVRQMQAAQHQIAGLIQGAVESLRKTEAGGIEATGGVANEIANAAEYLGQVLPLHGRKPLMFASNGPIVYSPAHPAAANCGPARSLPRPEPDANRMQPATLYSGE